MSELTSCVKRCCVNGCYKSTRTHPFHSFFRFPVEKERYVKWLEAIDRLDILEKGFQLSSYRVCESHFPRSCISMFVNNSNPRNKCLTRVAKNAVPTLNLPIFKPGEPSQIKANFRRKTNCFRVPPRREELTVSAVEIVSVPPDPLFKYKNLTTSATNTSNFHSLLSDKCSNNTKSREYITKIKKNIIPIKVSSELPNQQSIERSLVKSVNCSSNVKLSLQGGVKLYSNSKGISNFRRGDNKNYYMNSQPGLIPMKVCSQPLNQHSTEGRSLFKTVFHSSDVQLKEGGEVYKNSTTKNYELLSNFRRGDNENHHMNSEPGVIPMKVYPQPPNKQSTEERSLLKRVICSSDVQLNFKESGEVYENSKEKNYEFVSNFKKVANENPINKQPSSSQTLKPLIPASTLQCLTPRKDYNNTDTYMNLITKITEDERFENSYARIRNEYDDYYFSSKHTSKHLVNIRPVFNNMLELSPEILKNTKIIGKSKNVDIFSDAGTIKVTSKNLNKKTFIETETKVEIEDVDEFLEDNAESYSAQPDNVNPDAAMGNEIVIKAEDDDKLTDTFCVKAENIQDLLDVTDTQLIQVGILK